MNTNEEAARDLATRLHYPEQGIHGKTSIIVAFLGQHDSELRAELARLQEQSKADLEASAKFYSEAEQLLRAAEARITVLNGEVAGLREELEKERKQRSIHEIGSKRNSVRAEKAESQVAALREALDLSQGAIETFFHHWKHGGISRDNQFHQQTAFVLREAHRKIKALPASPSIQEPAKVTVGICSTGVTGGWKCLCPNCAPPTPPSENKI